MHPREFGKYRILKLLPKGGMGSVYLALDTASEEQVALKLIELGPDRDRVEIAAAEKRGATLQKQLCHRDRRITQIRSFGELEGFFFIEMEYIDGHDLSEVLRPGPVGVPFAARIGCDLCEVLNLAHTFTVDIEGQQYRGVVHGDIKPRNIRITPQGELRVLDFGIAKALSLTRNFTQIQFGSSQYSSPERLQTGEVNVASDLWSVAVVLYESVTGRPYFEAESGEKLEALVRSYCAVRPLPGNLPVPFAAILRKALHPLPENRYESAQAFGFDLQAFLQARPTAAASVPLDDDSDRTRRTVVPLDEDGATRRTAIPLKRSPSSPRQRQLAVLGAGAVAALFIWFLWHEASVWRQGNVLARELQTEKLTDLNAAWVRYRKLDGINHLPLILHTPRKTILDRLTWSADRVILDYRNSESPTVTEGDWMRAHASLAKALELDPSDRAIRGKVYLCEAHLARIRGTSRLLGKLLNESRSKFEGAHELMGKSPDPYLGLARLYVYALKDVDKAEDALKQAAKRGHETGRREKAQLADGYRERAERLLREADRSTGFPEEEDYLKRVQSDFRRAEDLYRDIVPFAGSPAGLRRVLDYNASVDERLKAIREGA